MKSRFAILCTLFALVAIGHAQTKVQQQDSNTDLSAAEKVLVEGSAKAIIATGVSEQYFKSHFKLFRVVNQPADRRVMWQFSLNEYQAFIKDSIGYYMQGSTRVNTHNISETLGKTLDITRTIRRARALLLMKKCIGSFSDSSVEYRPINGRAELLLVAAANPRLNEREREEAREREKEEQKKAIKRSTHVGNDEIESEEEDTKIPPVIFGYINLQTGKCTKGAGLSSPLVGF